MSIYDIGEAQPAGQRRPIHFIAMELVDGVTLRDLNEAPVRELLGRCDYAMQVADDWRRRTPRGSSTGI